MKSVGEVMAIGRTFPEVIQKATRMLDIGVFGVDPDAYPAEDLDDVLTNPTPTRIFNIARALRSGYSVDRIHEMTGIDRWFLHQLAEVVAMHNQLNNVRGAYLDRNLLEQAKRLGFSDQGISLLTGIDQLKVRRERLDFGIKPHIAKIDTLAAEFPAETNYLYSTYHASSSETAPSNRKKIMVPRLRYVPHRFERRVRLVLRERGDRGRGAGLRDHHAQLQPGDGQHGLRRL